MIIRWRAVRLGIVVGLLATGFLVNAWLGKVTHAEDAAPKAGTYVFEAADARLQGGPNLDKDLGVITHWLSPADRALWSLPNAAGGYYDIVVTWGVEEEYAHRMYHIDIDNESTLRGHTSSTGGPDKFRREVLGRTLLGPGKHRFVFYPNGAGPKEFCALKRIELVPAPPIAESIALAPPVPLQAPDGFVVERIAAPPQTYFPMLACFDDRGRMYVTESSGINAGGDALQKNPPNEVRILEDVDGDGKYEKSTVFADKFAFPEGILWHDGAVYVASPPAIWRLRDTNGDNVADEREQIVTGLPIRGMSDDMHGSSLGPDGRVYFACGRFGHKIHSAGAPPAHEGIDPLILRCQPDGTELEVYCGGPGNAVGTAFNDAGDVFTSGTFGSTTPGGRDVLNHCVDGGVYCVLGRVVKEHKWTGEEMPSMSQVGVAAESDLMMCRGDNFGADYRGNLFSAPFNMRKIFRHILEPDGATFRCRNEDFVVSSSTDFHPTDVFEDADGSMIIVDTGGWFVVGCPTSQIGKPQVHGGIYRVRRKDAPKIKDPRGLALDWNAMTVDGLVALLDDGRFAVRDRAMAALAGKKTAAVAALGAAVTNASSPRARLNAVWTLSRIGGPEADAAVRPALADTDPQVRQAAVTAAGLLRDREAVSQLSKIVGSDTPPIRREAATSLGRIGDKQVVPALLEGLRGVHDRFLDHALVFALIRLDDRERTRVGLDSNAPEARRGALIALDQMDHGELTREDVAKALDMNDITLQAGALAVVARHPGWSDKITTLARQWLSADDLSDDSQGALRGVLMSFVKEGPVRKLIAESLNRQDAPRWTRLLLLEVIARSELSQLPDEWAGPVVAGLKSSDADVARQAVAAVGSFDRPLGKVELVALARNAKLPADIRVAAAAVVARVSDKLDADLFTFLCQSCGGDVEPVTRLAAARALGNAHLSDAQLQSLAAIIALAGPLELPALIGAFDNHTAAAEGKALVGALEKSPGLVGLPVARVVKLLDAYPPEVRVTAQGLLKRIEVDATAQRARLDELQGTLAGGDAANGKKLFFGAKASCSACHRVGAEGGQIGPNLAGVGAIRAPRDLLEAIVFPSASFVRGFEPVQVVTSNGIPYSGIIARENNDAIYLRSADRSEVRVPRTDIETMVGGTVSVMPQGLDKVLTGDELRDVIAFLSSLRPESAQTPR